MRKEVDKMRISEFIKELEKIKKEEGDIRVTTFDEYTASEGWWDYDYKDLWQDACICVELVEDDDDEGNKDREEPEKVVCIR